MIIAMELKRMPQKKIYDILYLHSPITYTVADYMYRNGYLPNNLIVLCARRTTWSGPYTDISDMAGWGTYEACMLLKRLSALITEGELVGFNLYLPHSAFHFAHILKTSALVDNLYYIEEGDASYVDVCEPVQFDSTLKPVLASSGLEKIFQLDLERIPDAGIHHIQLLEGNDPKYNGAFGLSPESFPSLGQVHVLDIGVHTIFPENSKVWLCMPCDFTRVFNDHSHEQGYAEKYFYSAIATLKALSATARSEGGELVVKLHPLDENQLDPRLVEEIYRHSTPYKTCLHNRQADAGIEPTLFNFHKFCVIGTSSASRYINAFHHQSKLIHFSLN